MAISKTLLILLFCTIFVTLILIRYNFNKPKDIPSHGPSLPQTCLKSNDVLTLRKSLFHSSMVHLTAPSTLDCWIQNKTGFEIGGPSLQTWAPLGVYDVVAKMDVTNFASNTLWESGLNEGTPFMWKNQTKGKQYIRDAVNLTGIPDEAYDFVMASHALEHIANPFKALLEWIRITRSGGFLLVIAPLKRETFDHKRDVALIEHLINDYHNQTTEADLSHLDDILRLHDLGRDVAAVNLELFKVRSEKNLQHRGLHQHVYDQELLYYMFLCLNLDVKVQITWHNNDLIIGQKQ